MRKLGYREDPPDPRDWSASEKFGSSGPVPQVSRNLFQILGVLDQGSRGSCVSQSIAQNLRGSMIRLGDPEPALPSRHWIDWHSRKSHHDENNDGGTFPRTAFAATAHLGFPRDEDCPYSTELGAHKNPPAVSVYGKADPQRYDVEYRRIFETGNARVDVTKRLLADGYMITFGTDVSDRFVGGDLPDTPVEPPVGLSIAGGHALLVVEHDDDRFLICNSWGPNWWRQGGFCYFSADYLAWQRTRDLWIVRVAPRWPT